MLLVYKFLTYLKNLFSQKKRLASSTFLFNMNQMKKEEIFLATKDFIVKKSLLPDAGLGLFANRTFQKGESLGPYKGQLLTMEECYKPSLVSLWGYMIDIEHIERAAPFVAVYPSKKMPLRYINHAPVKVKGKKIKGKKSINVEFKEISKPPYIEIVTTKEVKAGDEFYLYYGPGFSQMFLRNPKLKEYYLKDFN